MTTEHKLHHGTAFITPIDDGATLADGVRAAGDYDNETEKDMFGTAYLQVQWDGTAPSVGDIVAELWIIPEDGNSIFAEGGDAGLGTDDDPQAEFHVGKFTSINPSITVNEVLGIPDIRLYANPNRFVLKNISGQTFDSTWELRFKPYKFESA